VGSRWPYHHPRVGTSDAIVARGSVVGGDPRELEGWCVGIGNWGVETDKLPGIRFDGCHELSTKGLDSDSLRWKDPVQQL
jgi:hypothetical protein